MESSMTYSLPPLIEAGLDEAVKNARANSLVRRIWAKDASVWTDTDEAKWLGWLDIAQRELENIETYSSFASDFKNAGFTNVLLMGMGGSSLCPELLAVTFGKDNFHILDSTVPAQVLSIEQKLDLGKTLFIVASKSGSTLEPNCFKQYFFEKVSNISEKPGDQFVAITDPGSKMDIVAKEDGFRHVFYGDPEVGGRFSALSPFGMAAAASMGLDVKTLLETAIGMSEKCRHDEIEQNPGALLGLILGVCHANGRDKLTIHTSPEICDVGAWLEQLIAESTGKLGVSIIPVDQEPIEPAVSYGNDRLFISLKLAGTEDPIDLASIFAAGHPVCTIELPNLDAVSAEFYRWEFATAVAGSLMEINPFNQPDVESAKIEARKITDEYEDTGKLPAETPFFESNGIKLFTSKEYVAQLMGMCDEPDIFELLTAHFANVEDGDYFAILGYVEMNEKNNELMSMIRRKVLEKRLCATCLGFGPRFLHSTGQAYKGGANNGVFLQITSDDPVDVPVPGQKYTFGVVKSAQSRGDFQVLLDRGRRALRIHLPKESDLETIVGLFN